MNHPAFELYRNGQGRWVYQAAGARPHEGVQVLRAFPISAPDEGVSVVSAEGHELLWLATLQALPAPTRAQIEAALASREFMPEIRRIESVSRPATPSVWQVQTDRGISEFTLKGEEDIRRMAGHMLLISDSHGVHYLVRDLTALDRHSRRLLDHFL